MNKEPPLPGQEGVDTSGHSKDSKDPTMNIISSQQPQQLEEGHYSMTKNGPTNENKEHSTRIITSSTIGDRSHLSIGKETPPYNGDENSNNHNIRYPQDDYHHNTTSSNLRGPEEYKLPPITTRNISQQNNINNSRELVIDDGENNVTNKIITTKESFNNEQESTLTEVSVRELDNNNNLNNNLMEGNDDEEPTNADASMIVWCDMCNKG